MSYSETGHAINIANFQNLIEFVTAYGADYNPSKPSLKLTSLIATQTAASDALANVLQKNTVFNSRVNLRQNAFSNLRKLSTRILSALSATNALPETIKNAKYFNRKMHGKRASLIEVPLAPNAPVPNTISASQQSYTQLIQHLAGMRAVLESEPTYTPNETELQIATLIAQQADLTAKNTSVASAYTAVTNARLQRTVSLYTGTESIKVCASEVKKYVKSLYGASSPLYRQISGIPFRTK